MSAPPTVLLVDDEAALLRIMRRWLEQAGYAVLTAANGREALALGATQAVDLIVTDVRMPVMDGIALVTQWPDHPRPRPPVVFVTGFSGVSEADCRRLGVAAILAKPFEKPALLAAVARLVPAGPPGPGIPTRDAMEDGATTAG